MTEAPAPPIALPRQRGSVTVRQGGLHEDLDALHEGDPLWWGKDFVADRLRSMPPGTPYVMLVADLDSAPVGSAFLLGRGIERNGFAGGGLYVLPGARRRGVGRALVDAMAAATLVYGLPGYAAQTHEEDVESLAAAERMGFVIDGLHRESVLDLDHLDEAAATASVRRAESAGFELRSLADDATEQAWHEVYDVAVVAWRDAPDAEGAVEDIPYSVFRGFLPEPTYVLVAYRDGRAVGMTGVMDRAKDEALNTFFTGVLPEARGTGLSTALKAQHALAMRARGHHRIFTQNMTQNAPILAANDRLGFTVVPGYYSLGRRVGSLDGG